MVPVASPGRRLERDPVADGRQLFLGERLVTHPAGMLRLHLAGLRVDPVNVVKLNRHAGRDQAFGRVGRERARPVVVPSEIVQVQRHVP